jgi:hypothetical protein
MIRSDALGKILQGIVDRIDGQLVSRVDSGQEQTKHNERKKTFHVCDYLRFLLARSTNRD